MGTTEGKIRPKVLVEVANVGECAADDDTAHRVPHKAYPRACSELHVLEEVIELHRQPLPQCLH